MHCSLWPPGYGLPISTHIQVAYALPLYLYRVKIASFPQRKCNYDDIMNDFWRQQRNLNTVPLYWR